MFCLIHLINLDLTLISSRRSEKYGGPIFWSFIIGVCIQNVRYLYASANSGKCANIPATINGLSRNVWCKSFRQQTGRPFFLAFNSVFNKIKIRLNLKMI